LAWYLLLLAIKLNGMRIQLDPYKIGYFTQRTAKGNPKLNDEYWKTYYCVCKYYYDFDCFEYYVIPVTLNVRRWYRGDCVIAFPRQFRFGFGEIKENEPQDVKPKDWWIARDFKPYYAVIKKKFPLGYMVIYDTNDGDIAELYDDVYEAIERAKCLDDFTKQSERLSAKEKREEKLVCELENIKDKISKYENRKRSNPSNFSKKDQLTLELKYETKKEKEAAIEKIKIEIECLKEKCDCKPFTK
jgi:hypothetical protein